MAVVQIGEQGQLNVVAVMTDGCHEDAARRRPR